MTKFLTFAKLNLLISLELIKRHYKLISFIVLIFTLTFILQYKFKLFSSSDTISIGLIGTYQEHDLPVEVTRLLSSGLVKSGENGRMKADAALEWETNNDATVFKFRLKKDLKWIDGSAIKASELDLSLAGAEISYLDDSTIQFKLKESYAPLPSLLLKPVFKKNTLLGIGPYKLERIEKSRIFITKLYLSPKEKGFPKVVVRFYPNEKTAVSGFKLGEVQALFGVSSTGGLLDNSLIAAKRLTDYSKFVALLYNTKDNVLSNRSLRQALSYSAPKIESEVISQSPIPPVSWGYLNEGKNYLDNLEEANSAIQRAKSSIKSEDLDKEIVITSTPQLNEVGKRVAEAWGRLGLKSNLKIESGIPQNFQIMLITQSIPADPDQYFLWHSTQEKTNLSKYSSARVDKSLEDGRKAIKEEERLVRYQDFQRTLLEDAPATFLYFPKYNIVYLKKAEEKLDQILPIQHPNLF